MLVRNQQVFSSNLDGDIILFHEPRGQYFGLSAVSRVIWECLKTPTSLDALHATLQARFTVTPEQCEKETQVVIQHMLDQGLIQECACA